MGRAVAFDSDYGVSGKLGAISQKVGASVGFVAAKAQGLDEQYGVSGTISQQAGALDAKCDGKISTAANKARATIASVGSHLFGEIEELRDEEEEDALKALFALIDVNADGRISQEEWCHAFDLI